MHGRGAIKRDLPQGLGAKSLHLDKLRIALIGQGIRPYLDGREPKGDFSIATLERSWTPWERPENLEITVK